VGDEWSGKGMSNVKEVLVNGWVYEALLRCHAPPAEVTSTRRHGTRRQRIGTAEAQLHLSETDGKPHEQLQYSNHLLDKVR